MNHIRTSIRELTDRRRRTGMKDIREVVEDLNPVLRGWGNDFRTGNASLKFTQLDLFVHERLFGLIRKRGGDRRKAVDPAAWPVGCFVKRFGLHQLLGTIRYPNPSRTA
jgi:RNA-directed DNA polymerase